MSSVCPAAALTMRCISVKVSIFLPLMDWIRSPGWKPAAAAALLAWIVSTRAGVADLP